MLFCRSEKFQKHRSIIGSHFVTAPLSFLWVYGNLSAYMESYFRSACIPNCSGGDREWTLSLYLAMTCPGIHLSKLLADHIGLKWTAVVGAVLINIGLFGSAWTVQISQGWTTFHLGVVLGLAQGLTVTVCFQFISAWAPDKAVILMATTTASSTALSVLQNQVITAIVNPDNIKPDIVEGFKTYFSQRTVLDKVPTALVAYAAMALCLQVIGVLLMATPPAPPTPPTASILHLAENGKNRTGQETLNDGDGKILQMAANGKKKTDQEAPSDGDGNILNLLESSETQIIRHDLKSYGSNTDNADNEVRHNKNGFTRLKVCENGTSVHTTVEMNEKNLSSSTQIERPQKSLKPVEVLKTPVFYALYLFVVAVYYALLLKANYYKQYALLYIQNDKYLTLVGTLVPIVSSVARVVCGLVLGRKILTIKDTIVFSLSVNCILLSFWYIAPQVNALVYMVVILSLASVQSLCYVIIPAACSNIFGPTHFSTNYGLALSSLLLMGLFAPLVISSLMQYLGWHWLFQSSSILCAVTLLFVVCVDFQKS